MAMVCQHCDNSDIIIDDPQDIERISCSDSSLCKFCVELANLNNAIDRLEMKRQVLDRKINRNHSLFIRTIPPEIIAKISGFAITNFAIRGRSLFAPILLSSICSDWRRAVVGTPELWSSIEIDLSRTYGKSILLRLATYIDEWLSRSGQLPLNITFCYEGTHQHTWRLIEWSRPVFTILNRYSSRWHSLNIISLPLPLLTFLRPDCLPLLEQFHLKVYGYGRDVEFPPSPCLKRVKIYETLESPDIGIQWDTVTHVSVERIPSRNCFALLRLCPNLVHCTFGINDNINISSRPLESPIVSSLTYLSLRHKRDKSRFFDNIKLPCLETLVLLNVITDPVIPFIKRSACSLHTLSLLEWHFRKTDKLLPILQYLSPSLKRLAISRSTSPIQATKNYLSILTRIYASQSGVVEDDFLPHLEIFEYREESPSTLESSMLSNLPSPSRNYTKPATTSISLRSAYINLASIIDKDIPHDISVILQHLEKDGILTYT